MLRAAAAALSLATAAAIAVRSSGAVGDAAQEARAEILKEFGDVAGLCEYFRWPVRDQGSRKPDIFYATVVGNNGQQTVYDINFAEIHPFVAGIVAVDPLMTHRGKSRNLSLDMSEARWQRYLPKLRHVPLASPIPEVYNENIWEIPEEQQALLMRPGHAYRADFGLEQYIRAQTIRGLKDESGGWITHPDDIIVVADSDEIPLRETLLAMTECEAPNFGRVRKAREAKEDMVEACSKSAKVLLKSQVFEYFADCPLSRPIWWHPDAVPAGCIMEGGLDMEDVRTGSSGDMTEPTSARHLHNFGMSIDDVIFKYAHYVESSGGEGLGFTEHQEKQWRACDAAAPAIGPGGWHSPVRPATDLIRPDNARGYSEAEANRRGVSREFALLKEKPELAEKAYWGGHSEKGNPYVGGPGGEYDYTGRLAAIRKAIRRYEGVPGAEYDMMAAIRALD